METPEFAVLRTFRSLFEGTRYKHRDSSLGDFVASHLYEDLVALNKSPALVRRVQAHEKKSICSCEAAADCAARTAGKQNNPSRKCLISPPPSNCVRLQRAKRRG